MKIFTALVIAFFALLTGLFIGQKTSSQPLSQSSVTAPAVTLPPVSPAVLALEPAVLATKSGQPLRFNIILKTDRPLHISTLSLRLSYNYQYLEPFFSQMFKVTPNPSLLENNWSYLVNKISQDRSVKKVNIDLALANVAPQGYWLNGTIILGSLNFLAQQPGSQTFNFEPNESKLIGKDGENIRLKLEGGNYRVF